MEQRVHNVRQGHIENGFSTGTFGQAESHHAMLICISITTFTAPRRAVPEMDFLWSGAKARRSHLCECFQNGIPPISAGHH